MNRHGINGNASQHSQTSAFISTKLNVFDALMWNRLCNYHVCVNAGVFQCFAMGKWILLHLDESKRDEQQQKWRSEMAHRDEDEKPKKKPQREKEEEEKNSKHMFDCLWSLINSI